MKKILAVLVLLAVFTVGLTSCHRNEGRQRVVFITRAQADLFAAWLANSMRDEARKHPHIRLDIQDGQANDAKQNELIENAIVNKYDLIILQPNDLEAQKPAIHKAVAAGIPIILTNPRLPDPAILAAAHSVDADPYEQGAVVARYALDLIPQNARVVVLRGPDGNIHSIERRRSWTEEFFARRPDVVIVGEQTGNWNKDAGMRLMEDWVQAHAQIDAVISMNDNMAMGALEAVKGDPRFDNLLAFGVDGDAAAALLIQEGSFTATSFQNPEELARKCMDLANAIFNEEVEGIVHVDIDGPLYHQGNIEELVAVHRKTGAIK